MVGLTRTASFTGKWPWTKRKQLFLLWTLTLVSNQSFLPNWIRSSGIIHRRQMKKSSPAS
jgi:hypothetical protein